MAMKTEIQQGIDGLQRQFPESKISVREDEQGGAYITLEDVVIGEKYNPVSTWIGFHIPSLYPYADIYPTFIDGSVKRRDGVPFAVPITSGYKFEDRVALQVSRRNNMQPASGFQTPTAKILKILDFLEKLT